MEPDRRELEKTLLPRGRGGSPVGGEDAPREGAPGVDDRDKGDEERGDLGDANRDKSNMEQRGDLGDASRDKQAEGVKKIAKAKEDAPREETGGDAEGGLMLMIPKAKEEQAPREETGGDAEGELMIPKAKEEQAPQEETGGDAEGELIIPKAKEEHTPQEETGGDAEGELIMYLSLDLVCAIASRLPTKAAYRFIAVSWECLAMLSSPPFLHAHLSPRPLLAGDAPDSILLQPVTGRLGYSHVTIIDTTELRTKYNMPLRTEDAEYFMEALDTGTPAPNFLQRTVRELDMVFVASHGRLLLGRNATNYFLCSPAEDRFVKLPLPMSVVECRDRETASGLYYYLDAGRGGLVFTVIVIVRLGDRRIAVETFSSSAGAWETREMDHDAGRYLGDYAPPGIYVGGVFYWVSQRAPQPGFIIAHEVASGRTMVIGEPPQPDGLPRRLGRSLGSADGRLRMCAFDDDGRNNFGFRVVRLDGVLGIWERRMGAWTQMRRVVIGDVQWVYQSFFRRQLPVDFADASTGWILVKKDRDLFRRNVVTGELLLLSNMYFHEWTVAYHLYSSFRVFRVDI